MSDDLLIGYRQIHEFLATCAPGVTIRQVQGWVERGNIPSFKIGGRVAARKSELDAALRSKPAA